MLYGDATSTSFNVVLGTQNPSIIKINILHRIMKTLITLIFGCSAIPANAQTKEAKAPGKSKEVMVVEASCGQCRFGLPGKSCDLAVRINGRAYFVDGSNIDSHGDAHAKDGFCNAIRKAEVQGQVVDKRFKAAYFHLLPDTAVKKVFKG